MKTRFYSSAFDKHFEAERIIGEFHGEEEGPVLVFFGGVHGNESAGVIALINVMAAIREMKPKIRGSIYAISGNLNALHKDIRFEVEDLNRIWTRDRMRQIERGTMDPAAINADVREQMELYELGKKIFKKHKHQVYCIDLHTTSAPTVPFITLNDTLINRDFATRFPVPVIIGIEEFLAGPILSWVMEIGYPSLAFEAGEHNDPHSVSYHEAFVWLSLANGGLISEAVVPDYQQYFNTLEVSNPDLRKVFEVRFRREVNANEKFRMSSGYRNFQAVAKNEVLAENIQGEILASESGRIFMPLYQDQGEDGFFLVREVSAFWLHLSSLVRKLKFDRFLLLLPGIKQDQREKHTLVIDKRIARFLAVEIFHLLGYRIKQRLDKEIRVSKREYDVRGVVRTK